MIPAKNGRLGLAKGKRVLLSLTVIAALVVAEVAVAVVVPVSDAHAQARNLRRAIQKNIQTSVRRQLARLNIRGSAGAVSAMDLSPDGRYLATISADGAPRIWELKAGRQLLKLDTPAGQGGKIAFLPDSLRVAVANDSGAIAVYNITDGQVLRKMPGHRGAITAMTISDDGTTLITAGEDRKVRLWGIENGAQIAAFDSGTGTIGALDIGPTGQFLLSGGSDGHVRVWEAATGTAVETFSGHAGAVTAVRFGADETEAYSAGNDTTVRYWRIGDAHPVRLYDGAAAPVTSIALDATFERLGAGLADGTVVVWDTDGSHPVRTTKAHQGRVSALTFDVGAERAISAGEDAITKIWSLKSGTLILQLVSTKNGWAVVDDAGRFDGSNTALNDVQWVTVTQALPIDHFSDDYYEPGLLHKKRLGTGPLLTVGAASMKKGILPPPTSRIILPPPGAAMPTDRVRVEVVTEDQGAGIQVIYLYHNGKIVDRRKIEDQQRSARQGRETVRTIYAVRPMAGRNTFAATALSGERVLGMFAEASINVTVEARPPRLHVMAVGINIYRDWRLNLNYGVPDASAILSALRDTKQKLFADVIVHQLFDGAATKEAILQAIDGLGATNPEDVVVIYIAGHGVAAGDEWYFIPHEFRLPFTAKRLAAGALSSAELRERASNIEARRVFMLMDTCQSGTAVAAFEDFVDRRALRRLGRSVGMHLLAATAKQQQAIELPTLGHGVFTYSILRGLTGAADSTPADGNLTVQELIAFSEDQVPLLSNQYADHQQWPLTFSRGFDFTVASRPLH